MVWRHVVLHDRGNNDVGVRGDCPKASVPTASRDTVELIKQLGDEADV